MQHFRNNGLFLCKRKRHGFRQNLSVMSLHARMSAISLNCKYRSDSRQSKQLNSRINAAAQEKRSNYCNFCNVCSLASVLLPSAKLVFLHLSVSHSVHRVGASSASVHAGIYTPWTDTPTLGRHPHPWADTLHPRTAVVDPAAG